jgi:hypothetical protein
VSVSPPIRLLAFCLLLIALFLCARVVGGRLGPVTTTYSRAPLTGSGGGSGQMNMGGRDPAPVAPAAR